MTTRDEAIARARALDYPGSTPTCAEIAEVDRALRDAGLPDLDPFWVRWGYFVELHCQYRRVRGEWYPRVVPKTES